MIFEKLSSFVCIDSTVCLMIKKNKNNKNKKKKEEEGKINFIRYNCKNERYA